MTNTPKTAESSVAQAADNAAEEATGRRVRILSARSAGILALVLAAVVLAIDQGTKYRYPDAVGGAHHRHRRASVVVLDP